MIYVHFCNICKRIYLLNGHKMSCPKCNSALTELKVTYSEYISMNSSQREEFLTLCTQGDKIPKTTYRMYKYSKWYRNLQIINQDSCQNKQDS